MARKQVKMMLTEKERERQDIEKWVYGLKITYFSDLVNVEPREWQDFKMRRRPTKKQINKLVEELKREAGL